jgi:hypothetical protein
VDALSTRCIAEESANARNAYFAQRVLTLHGELSAAEAGHILIADLLLKWIRYRRHHVNCGPEELLCCIIKIFYFVASTTAEFLSQVR